MTCSFLKPERARSLRSSQPSPPAPTTKTSTRLPSRSRSCARGSTNETNHLGVKTRESNGGGGIEGRPLTPGLGSKEASTRFPGRKRSMSRSRHRSGSVGAGCSASGEAIAAARWVWLAFEQRGGRIRAGCAAVPDARARAGRKNKGCGGTAEGRRASQKKKRKGDGKNPGPSGGRPGYVMRSIRRLRWKLGSSVFSDFSAPYNDVYLQYIKPIISSNQIQTLILRTCKILP
jgi:hypothetical protein